MVGFASLYPPYDLHGSAHDRKRDAGGVSHRHAQTRQSDKITLIHAVTLSGLNQSRLSLGRRLLPGDHRCRWHLRLRQLQHLPRARLFANGRDGIAGLPDQIVELLFRNLQSLSYNPNLYGVAEVQLVTRTSKRAPVHLDLH